MDTTGDFSGTQSPSKNPFNCTGPCDGDSSFRIASFKDVGRPSLAVLTDGDFLARESLGLLPDQTLLRDSLTRQSLFININSTIQSQNEIGLHDHTFTRESLGILNISALDLNRESLGIFNFDLNAVKGQDGAIFKDPNTCLPVPQKSENKIPNIVLSTVSGNSDSSNFSGINRAFLYSTSRNFPSTSTCSDNLSFNTRSLEEISRICSISSRSYDVGLIGVKLDPLNEAFQVMPEINMLSLSDKIGSSEFAANIELLRNRIKSWPLVVDKNAFLEDLTKEHRGNASFDEGFICRGVEQEKYGVDSVFLDTNNESLVVGDKSFNEERYLLDCTPQPEWGDWDTSKSAEIKETNEDILQKVDKLFGTSEISQEQISTNKIHKSGNSSGDNNFSQNISKISRASQCSMEQSGCNLSPNLSKISRCSTRSNAADLLKDLSDVIDGNDRLSMSKKKEAHQILGCLANLFKDNGSEEDQNAEDSGHSSVDDRLENKENEDPKVYEILDLSCKSNSGKKLSNNLSYSGSPIIKNPPPYSAYSSNHSLKQNTSVKSNSNSNNNSKLSNMSVSSQNNSNSSAKNESGSRISAIRRQSSLTQNKVNFSGNNKLKKTQSTGMLMSRQPMRAVLPVEKMTKTTKSSPKSVISTPEKMTANRYPLQSKKTSTPIQAPKLKPVAASTPATYESAAANGRPKLTRSFSYNPKASPDTQAAKSLVPKSDSLKPVRRNSVTENTLVANKTSEGSQESPKRRRAYSSGKDPKILSALSKVRQNILNSPYYGKKGTNGEKRTSELSTLTEKTVNVSSKKA